MVKSRFDLFIHNLQQELRSFLFFNFLLMLFRIAFLAVFWAQISTVSSIDVLTSLWYGFRISLKSAGVITIVTVVFATIPVLVFKWWPSEVIRRVWNYLAIIVLAILFMGRIPYYYIFNSGYNLMLYNGLQDDWYAIYETAVQQYDLFGRLGISLVIIFAICFVMHYILKMRTIAIRKHKKLTLLAIAGLLSVLMIFIRFGGSFNYTNSIHWENADRMSNNLLNEAILDDMQSLYRAYSINIRMNNNRNLTVSAETLKEKIGQLGGNLQAPTVDDAFKRITSSKSLGLKQQTVVMIFGENYAYWPFLPRYANLNLVEYGNKFANSDNGAVVQQFLPNGGGTMPSLESMLTGLDSVGLYANYREETFKEKYQTGIGNVMKKLGYKTCFWYGGFGSWQNIKNFALAQGFDEFHGAQDFSGPSGNAWGVPDEELFAEMTKNIEQNSGQKVFYFVLTTSNHPPFSLDVDRYGFQREAVVEHLPSTISYNKETIDQMGHIWYSDQMLGKFVERTRKLQEDALFVITGDHADRFQFTGDEDLEAKYVVPCIFYGKGISKELFPEGTSGRQSQIIPTLVEVIEQPGFSYSSLYPSMTEKQGIPVFNENLWSDGKQVGWMKDIDKLGLSDYEREYLHIMSDASKTISIWRIKKGNNIE